MCIIYTCVYFNNYCVFQVSTTAILYSLLIINNYYVQPTLIHDQ